jgi:hypothetical protein
LVIDSTVAQAAQRVLIKDCDDQAENGIYVVTTVGTASTPYVMTRASDADTYGEGGSDSLDLGSYFFTTGGTTQKGAAYVCNTAGTITFGTTPITFAEFSQAQVYSAGNGISITLGSIALNTPVTVASGGTGLTTSPTNGQLLIGNGSNYTLSTLTAGSGVSITNSAGSITLSATGLGGTVTAVTATGPLASSGGTTPDISIANSTGTGSVVLENSPSIFSATITAAVSASITTITGSSANITTVTGTTAGFSSANITQLGSTSATIATLSGTNVTYSSGTVSQLAATSATIASVSGTNATYSNGNFTSATVTTVSGTTATYTSATVTNATVSSLTLTNVKAGFTVLKQDSVNEGGEFYLQTANSSTLSGGGVVIDVNANTFRIFEAGGTFRGVSVDLAAQGSQSTLLTSTNYTANITTLAVTSGTITNLNSTSANITTLTGTTFGTTATTQLRGASAQITTLTSTSANITTITGTTLGAFTSGTITNLNSTSANITTLTGTTFGTTATTQIRANSLAVSATGAKWDANGDIYAVRSGGTSGVIFLGNSGVRYLFYDGGQYYLNGANLAINGALAVTANSGTYAISISGNAATVTNGFYTTGGTMTGQITTRETTGATPIVSGSGSNSLQVMGNPSNGAWFSFHRAGAYAINMGLDTSNVLLCGGWSDGANYRWQVDSSGNFTARGNVTAYSDERVKKNWRPVNENLIEKIVEVKSGVYDRTDAELTQVGVSAQSLREVLPEAVFESNDGHLSVAYGNAALITVIELAKEVIKLKAEIEALKAAK